MNTEFTQHCDTSDTQITQLNESFDEDYIEEICIFSEEYVYFQINVQQNILSTETRNLGKFVYRLNNPEKY